MRLRLSALLLAAFATGCAPTVDEKDEGAVDGTTEEADADTDADTDADSDADSDADTDADTDADSDADTDADTDADLAFTGDMSLAMAIDGVGEDVCLGTISFDVDEGASPAIVGLSSCTFQGRLALAGEIASVMEADFTGDGDVIAGVATVAVPFLGDFPLDWGGTFDGTAVSSHVASTVEVEGYVVEYELDFDATR